MIKAGGRLTMTPIMAMMISSETAMIELICVDFQLVNSNATKY